MAVDIDSFKRDLDQLKNQRSVIQAKLDDANKHITELEQTLKGMGFDTVDAAKEAYVRQLGDAEAQHQLVKNLMQEIQQIDANIPTKEEVTERLKALSLGDFEKKPIVEQVVPSVQPVVAEEITVPDVGMNPPVVEQPVIQQPVVQQPVVQQVVPQVQETVQPVNTPPVAEFVSDMFEATAEPQLNNSVQQANNNVGQQGVTTSVQDTELDLGALLFSSL